MHAHSELGHFYLLFTRVSYESSLVLKTENQTAVRLMHKTAAAALLALLIVLLLFICV